MNAIKNLIRHLVVIPLDRRGVCFSLPRKKLERQLRRAVKYHSRRSLCPFWHFYIAYRALCYLDERHIPGDIAICGVWKGGLAAFLGSQTDRKLWLYDSFDGGSIPSDKDELSYRDGQKLKEKMRVSDPAKVIEYVDVFCRKRPQFIYGDVMHTLSCSENRPSQVALLYLDTDYYDSTYTELRYLESLVPPGGVIIQDDALLCPGAWKAIRRYYKDEMPFLVPISDGAVLWVKS